ncbi:MAG TPA: hypothetical protein PKN96_00625 [Flavobacterium sp.]|uniref:hypothetical protein n=1 Tax=Flavobacterium sp. TaxID=239 RepID=UPI002C5CD7E5|nr:hypothetical protein [Flavobacterium sp.]HNP31774.1 hypothetical protein [Flavobacterium sp.]
MEYKKQLFTSMLTFLVLCACKTNKTFNHHREGKWVYKDTINGVRYKSKGKYRRGCEVKTWKYFENGKLVKVEKYEDSICHIKTFDKKGKVTSFGQSMIIEDKDGIHWYLNDDWFFLDANGKLIGIKKYLKGELVSETKK